MRWARGGRVTVRTHRYAAATAAARRHHDGGNHDHRCGHAGTAHLSLTPKNIDGVARGTAHAAQARSSAGLASAGNRACYARRYESLVNLGHRLPTAVWFLVQADHRGNGGLTCTPHVLVLVQPGLPDPVFVLALAAPGAT